MNTAVTEMQQYRPQSQSLQALVPRSIQEAISLAETMASASLVPDHLRGKAGDCLLIVMQSQRWGMDALSVAQCTSVVRGKLCYEGKLVAAALYAMGAIDGRLEYEYSGNGQSRSVRITGTPRGSKKPATVEGTVAQWATDNGNWKKSPDDMLAYRGTRQWARRYAPEALLGVYTPDEIEEVEVLTEPQRDRVAMPQAKAVEPAPVDAEFTEVKQDAPEGIHDLSPGQMKLLASKAKGAGFITDDGELDQAALLEKFKRIGPENINDVLAQLREIAESRDAQ